MCGIYSTVLYSRHWSRNRPWWVFPIEIPDDTMLYQGSYCLSFKGGITRIQLHPALCKNLAFIMFKTSTLCRLALSFTLDDCVVFFSGNWAAIVYLWHGMNPVSSSIVTQVCLYHAWSISIVCWAIVIYTRQPWCFSGENYPRQSYRLGVFGVNWRTDFNYDSTEFSSRQKVSSVASSLSFTNKTPVSGCYQVLIFKLIFEASVLSAQCCEWSFPASTLFNWWLGWITE